MAKCSGRPSPHNGNLGGGWGRQDWGGGVEGSPLGIGGGGGGGGGALRESKSKSRCPYHLLGYAPIAPSGAGAWTGPLYKERR